MGRVFAEVLGPLIPYFNGYRAMMLLIINYNQQLLGVSAGFNANEDIDVHWISVRKGRRLF